MNATSPSLTTPARRFPRFRPGPLWLAVPGVLFLLAFLIYPSAQLLLLSTADRATGEFSLASFMRFLGPSVYSRVLNTTFVIALQTTACCLLLGYPLAYWLSGLPKRRQQITVLLVLLAFWTSALVKNFAWLVLLGRTGIVSQALAFIGVTGGDSLLFNRGAVVFAMTHTMLPLAIVTMLPVMNQIDKRLGQAAATLGAPRSQVFWRIFFSLSMRGVAAAGLLVFIGSLGFFITPALLGSPREMMIGQLIISQINAMQNWQMGSTLALFLIGSALLSCLAYDLVFGLSSLADDQGKARSSSGRRLRRAGIALLSALGSLFSSVERGYDTYVRKLLRLRLLTVYSWLLIFLLLFPIFSIVPMAFTANTFLSFPPKGFSTQWFQTYFESTLWVTATLRSFGIGVVVACITAVIASLAAYGVVRGGGRAGSALFLLFMLPMIIPSIVTAVALFYLFAKMGLVATNLGIMIGHVVISMPVVFVIMLTTFKGHDWALDRAAGTLGANRVQVAWKITLPLVKDGLAAALVTGFLLSFEELTVALFIGGGLKTTLPKQLWDDILLQVNPTLAAASVVVLTVVTLLFLLLQWIGGRGKTVAAA